MAFKFSLAADFSDVIRESKRGGDALEDVVDTLDDIARDSQTQMRRVEQSLDGVADEAQDTSRDLERRFSDAFRDVERQADTSTRRVSQDTDRNMGRASESVDEFKRESASNFSEVASSFTGDMDSAVDLVQGTFGGLAGGLAGPVGIASGVLAGIGGAMYASFSANAAASEERIASMFEDMAESGLNYASEQFVVDELTKIYNKAEDAAIAWGDLQDAAERTGLSQEVVARAFAGDAEAGAILTERLTQKQQALRDQVVTGEDALTDWGRTNNAAVGRARDELDPLIGQWERATTTTESARDRVNEWRSAVNQFKGTTQEATSDWVDLTTYVNQFPTKKTTTVTVVPDLTYAERAIRGWRPVITGVVRAGMAAV